jgi:hypothetical protein
MNILGGIIQSIGAILCVWGIIWYLWDHYATSTIYLLVGGLVLLLIGWLLIDVPKI